MSRRKFEVFLSGSVLWVSLSLVVGCAKPPLRQSVPLAPKMASPNPNPILPGDHPDPTIIRVGQTYWTTSTAGNWAPEFLLYKSSDLFHWSLAGSIFPKTPAWGAGNFWAPELVYDGGRILLYYVARKSGGPLCVAVATATDPGGPYVDHGPIICQSDGSIDPSFVRDEHGTPYLIWKEDGNSIHQPTPIWAQPLTPDLLHLMGDKTQLIVNDPDTWEGGVAEAPYIMHHGDYFYLFYAGNSCCGVHCNYAEGVARAGHLTGPWQKDPANPIIHANSEWRCPGHGTAVQTATGDTYLIYHAYPVLGTIFVGRESLMDQITWNLDGWPVVNAGKGPSGQPTLVDAGTFEDKFDETQLSASWRWPIDHYPILHVGGGHLVVDASSDGSSVFLARALLTPEFITTVGIGESTASGGLGVIGDLRTKLVLTRAGNVLSLARTSSNSREVVWSTEIEATKMVWLRALSVGGRDIKFSYSLDDVHWADVSPTQTLAHIPPWDQGLHIGLVVNGRPNTSADFYDFTLSALVKPKSGS